MCWKRNFVFVFQSAYWHHVSYQTNRSCDDSKHIQGYYQKPILSQWKTGGALWAKLVLIKKKVLELGSKNIKIIDKINVYDTYKDYYFCNDRWETKLLKANQSENGLKVRLGAARMKWHLFDIYGRGKHKQKDLE